MEHVFSFLRHCHMDAAGAEHWTLNAERRNSDNCKMVLWEVLSPRCADLFELVRVSELWEPKRSRRSPPQTCHDIDIDIGSEDKTRGATVQQTRGEVRRYV